METAVDESRQKTAERVLEHGVNRPIIYIIYIQGSPFLRNACCFFSYAHAGCVLCVFSH